MSQSSMEPQQVRPMRPRAKSGFSITSDRSDKTSKSKELKHRESHDQKNHLSETTKANPNAAMTEMQPMQQQLESATMGSLRGGQYTDVYGQLITDPDLSNPTRRRTERPLETIRSFEAAIDSEWKRTRAERPESMMRNDSAPEGYDYSSRRSSAYWGGGHDQVGAGSRFSHVGGSHVGGYYNQRGDRSSYYENGNGQRTRMPNGRQQSDSALNRYNNGQGVYPSPHYGQSSATVNTGGSNGSASDQWQQSTDPSSESSSIDRDGQHAYPVNAGPRQPIAEEGNYTYNNGSGNGNGNGFHPGYVGPPVPAKSSGPPRQVISLSQSSEAFEISQGGPVGGRPQNEKRKSWLRRTFSKGG